MTLERGDRDVPTRRRRLCFRKFHTSKGPGVGLTGPGPALSWAPGGAFEERRESTARAAVSFPTVNALRGLATSMTGQGCGPKPALSRPRAGQVSTYLCHCKGQTARGVPLRALTHRPAVRTETDKVWNSQTGCRQWRTPCQLNDQKLTICVTKVWADARQGGRHADTTRIRGFRFMRDLRNYGVCCYCGVGPRCAARSERRRHAKDFVAGRRSSAGLCDGTCGSDNRAGSAARATHASGNRIRLCHGRRFRASHTRSTDPRTQSRRCFPNTGRNAACGWKPGDAKTRILITYVVEKGKPLASPA
jgi:hypothetical protein